MMARDHLKVQAKNRKAGMTLTELKECIAGAEKTGFNELDRVEIGFKSQVQSVTFTKGEDKA